MAAVTICSDFGAPQNKVWHCFPIYFPWSGGTGCHDLRFLNVALSANFFTLHFHFHQEAFEFLFTFCHKGGVIYISEVILFLLVILIPACASSSSACLMMYSAYKLNKIESDNIHNNLKRTHIIDNSVTLTSNLLPYNACFKKDILFTLLCLFYEAKYIHICRLET